MGPMVRSRFLYVSAEDLGVYANVGERIGRPAPTGPTSPSERSPRLRRPDWGERPGDETQRRVGWRLIGANNRELGRSAAVFESLELCRAAVLRLREGVGIGQARVLFAMSDTAWTWRMELGGHQAAMSGRTYQRQREAQHNLSLFLIAVPLAQLSVEMPGRPRRGLQLPRPGAEGRGEAGSPRAHPGGELGGDAEGDTVRLLAAGPQGPAVRS